MRPSRAILFGTLTVGVLDGLDAIIFVWLRNGVGPARVFRAIAAGVLGRETATAGGTGTALLGVALHFTIAFLIVSTYYLASRKLKVLTERAMLCGVLYGIAAYLVMNYVVIPLSAITRTSLLPATPALVNGILIHMLGVGLPSALFARAAKSTDA